MATARLKSPQALEDMLMSCVRTTRKYTFCYPSCHRTVSAVSFSTDGYCTFSTFFFYVTTVKIALIALGTVPSYYYSTVYQCENCPFSILRVFEHGVCTQCYALCRQLWSWRLERTTESHVRVIVEQLL